MTNSPQLPALPVTFRPTRTRVVLLAVGAAVFVVITAVSFLLDLGGGERASFIFTAALFLAVLMLLSRPHVSADEDGVTVVNLTTKRRLEWAEVLGVHLRSGDPWVSLDLADGTSMAAMGIQPGIAKQHAVADARALRALVERRGTGEGTPDTPAGDGPGR
ncbi:PH domain-containing protein [Streptomyces sp. NBC_01795]|uniref:PH domain-containing protein n=1 Tax=unclassified Streptomyces TaxID=2593676 RepID=UPI002DDBB374|nr:MULTISPECIES: PH domain-containing protein [unclassified Streptomyces]WSA96379.1 PH domain-containing protein [Streptomyces sp. NBC_01795]WSB80793.1 PH domain-containing protein [Streptomyces sp. NBC_01775]